MIKLIYEAGINSQGKEKIKTKKTVEEKLCIAHSLLAMLDHLFTALYDWFVGSLFLLKTAMHYRQNKNLNRTILMNINKQHYSVIW
jgi:hypothetical protein